ncbi:MAG: 50S ribosomal protein L10 [bacterium]
MNREGKKSIVAELQDKFQKSQSIVFADFIGMSVSQMEDLRGKARASNVEIKVVKNTLAKRAYDVFGDKEGVKFLTHNTAVGLGYDDPIIPIKVLLDYAKENDKLNLKGALIQGKCIDKEKLKTLASIPSKEVLLTQLVTTLQSPIQGLVNVLSGPMRSLVTVLKAIEEKKE